MTRLPIRLGPGADLRRALEEIARREAPDGAFVLCGVGSLAAPCLRFADDPQARVLEGPYEILTLSGSIADGIAHLHVAVADAHGAVLGGHVAYGSEVRTTVEALLELVPGWRLSREHDPGTGFSELVVRTVEGDG
jgi:predicted DNA-binding protein with PD1-like motif